MSEERNCSKCKHYKLTDQKLVYEPNGCGTKWAKIYGCEKWECEFAPKEEPCEKES